MFWPFFLSLVNLTLKLSSNILIHSFLHLYFLYGYLQFSLRSFFKCSGKSKKTVLCQRCRNPVREDENHEPVLGQMAEGAGRGREALV